MIWSRNVPSKAMATIDHKFMLCDDGLSRATIIDLMQGRNKQCDNIMSVTYIMTTKSLIISSAVVTSFVATAVGVICI